MLLVGGIRAWCNLVRENPLRSVQWETEASARATSRRSHSPNDKSRLSSEIGETKRGIAELDLEAESQWLESLHSERYGSNRHKLTAPSGQSQRQLPKLDTTDQKKLNRSMVISSPSNDPYNKSLLDFVRSILS